MQGKDDMIGQAVDVSSNEIGLYMTAVPIVYEQSLPRVPSDDVWQEDMVKPLKCQVIIGPAFSTGPPNPVGNQGAIGRPPLVIECVYNFEDDWRW
jgi:hypothetical protein